MLQESSATGTIFQTRRRETRFHVENACEKWKSTKRRNSLIALSGKGTFNCSIEIGIIVCNSESMIMSIRNGGYSYILHRWHAIPSPKLIAMTVNEAKLYLRKLGIIEALSINIDDEHNRYAASDSQLPDRKSQYGQATININIRQSNNTRTV